MEVAQITGFQIIQLIVMMAVGFIGYKTKIITREGNKHLSKIILYILTPIVLFVSYQKPFSMQLLNDLGICFLLSILIFVVSFIFVYFTIVKKHGKNFEIEEIEVVFTNCGFVGIPLAAALFGDLGIFYVTSYITIFNLVLWTYGISIFSGKFGKKQFLKAFLNPCIIAVFLGLVFFILQIKLPEVLMVPLQSVSNTYVPFAMIIIGCSLGQASFSQLIKNKRVFLISFYRLIAVPIIFIIICIPLRGLVNQDILLVMYIAALCPAAATGPMFSEIYDKDTIYASSIVCLSTIFSAITIPAIMYLQSMI